jgi:hypothetical protein
MSKKKKRSENKAVKAQVTRIAKAKVGLAKESFQIILPGDEKKVPSKLEKTAENTINVIHELLEKSKYADNVKTDTLRKLVLFLDKNSLVKMKEQDMIRWLMSDVGVKTIKKINVTVTK